MGKNIKGGKKHKRGKNQTETKKLIFKDENCEDQHYGLVKKLLGSANFIVKIENGNEILCKIRGSMKKRCWIKENNVVIVNLINLNDLTKDKIKNKKDLKGIITHKYNDDETRWLKRKNITKKLYIDPNAKNNTTENSFIFENRNFQIIDNDEENIENAIDAL